MLTAVATAAAPLATVARSGPAAADGAEDQAYQTVFQEAVSADRDVRRCLTPGKEFLHRPRQLLVADADLNRVVTRLRQSGYQVTVGNRFAGVTKLFFDREVDIPSIVAKLRDPRQWPNEPVPAAQPHHVMVGFGNIMGNPGGPPQVAPALTPPDPGRAGEGDGVTVGICDTGIWRDAGVYHPAWLGGSYLQEPDDEDALYSHDDVLAPQGGHGTFVAGVVRQAAPGVRFDPEQALNSTGTGDEEMLVGALGRLSQAVAVINLSLGYFTQDDLPPLPIGNALGALPKTTAVVAAAGNAGASRPAWPAAFDEVVAVAALRRTDTLLEPAGYSDFGPWVDACAVGDRVSTYVKGQLVLPGVPAKLFLGYAGWAGTSFAAAHVSGRLAAMMTAGGLDAAQARQVLLAQPRWHPDYGVLVT